MTCFGRGDSGLEREQHEGKVSRKAGRRLDQILYLQFTNLLENCYSQSFPTETSGMGTYQKIIR